jgi:hypothetical protein
MDSFTVWTLRRLSEKQEKPRLSKVSNLIDWMPIRQILEEMYDNKSERGGRPNCDVILMFKILILQQWYGLNDLEVERQMADRISFMSFLGFPDPFPDSRTIWLFRERMANTGKDKMVWAELQKQLDAMGLQVSLTLVSESLDEVETSSVERFKMPHSSRLILDDPISQKMELPRLDTAEMEHGQKRAKKAILAISSIRKAISITALFAELRPLRLKFMIVRLISLRKAKSSSGIEDISACLPEVMTLRWCEGLPMHLWEDLTRSEIG